jgi:hypothetical protein
MGERMGEMSLATRHGQASCSAVGRWRATPLWAACARAKPCSPWPLPAARGRAQPRGQATTTAQVDDGDPRQASGVDAGRAALQKIAALNFVRKNKIN